MSMPFYVAPEQWMKDKADFARKGIARGRALAALNYADGILICAENSSATLRKVSEIYDRIAFAGAGKYNEYDRLRIAGVRHADLKGYSFSREDVDAQSLANAYAQMLGDVFTHEAKPMEVEILVAEVGADPSDDRLFHILYDGTVVDEHGFTVLGGEAETIIARLKETYTAGRPLDAALQAAVSALAGSDRELTADTLEVAVLSRGNGRRAFRRLTDDDITRALAGAAVEPEGPAEVPTVEPTPVEPTGSAGDTAGSAGSAARATRPARPATRPARPATRAARLARPATRPARPARATRATDRRRTGARVLVGAGPTNVPAAVAAAAAGPGRERPVPYPDHPDRLEEGLARSVLVGSTA